MKKGAIDTKKEHIPCFAHTLNLLAKDVMNSMVPLAELKSKVSSIVTLTKKSSTVKANFEQCQKDLGLPVKKLIQDVPTRWNSTYCMLERFQEQRAAITKFVEDHEVRTSIGYVSEEEWTNIGHAVELLQPLYETTMELSAEKSVTSSKVLPLSKMLMKCYREARRPPAASSRSWAPPLSFREELENSIQVKLVSRLNSIEANNILSLATILDPRFKRLGFITNEGADRAAHLLRREASGKNVTFELFSF